ncbi:MAG: twin-arginine translocase subunit TatB [Deltaproteobacteria bacterium]|nr:twin-arginine translocase subunit TatB [Deltaproteobacteria bacterium]
MFGIGMPELAVILVVALVVLGPRRLPEIARALGKGLAEFRKVTGEVNKELQGARDMIEAEAREHDRLRRQQERAARQTANLKATADAAAASADPATLPASTASPDASAAAPTTPEAAAASSASSTTSEAESTAAPSASVPRSGS